MKSDKKEMQKRNFFFIFIFLIFSFRSFARLIQDDFHFNFSSRWLRGDYSEKENISQLLKILSYSSTGKKLIQKAEILANKRGEDLLEIILAGESSFTDTTVYRRFASKDPSKVSYESRAKVFIDKNHQLRDGVLDLAHELTHFSYRKSFNPYEERFDFKKFIKSTLEGRGGEVDAYMVECQVQKELFPREFFNSSNCEKIFEESTFSFSRKKAVEEFYKVGKFYPQFLDKAQSLKVRLVDFPFLSEEKASFISSSYGLPYPVAALLEFRGVLKKVCRNDYQRLRLLKKRGESLEMRSFEKKYFDRCVNSQIL